MVNTSLWYSHPCPTASSLSVIEKTEFYRQEALKISVLPVVLPPISEKRTPALPHLTPHPNLSHPLWTWLCQLSSFSCIFEFFSLLWSFSVYTPVLEINPHPVLAPSYLIFSTASRLSMEWFLPTASAFLFSIPAMSLKCHPLCPLSTSMGLFGQPVSACWPADTICRRSNVPYAFKVYQ